ncbi:hypothetical protein [Treponema phagedenis]|uniref:hypothetical protein n=1 Tax=Treponema phagedenis TaxID=162 RepID=UPI0001F63FF9|nr:hypothetical protein [Treponema phagedenis]EFW37122.1 hypothetical protein HMPREF9554_02431 [Treponema phagedenis F0421]
MKLKLRQILNIIVLTLAGILTVLPLCFYLAGKIINIPFFSDSSNTSHTVFAEQIRLVILSSEGVLTHIVFIFVCFAGIITSADKKQLNIEVFVSKLSILSGLLSMV